MDREKFEEDSLLKFLSYTVCLGRPYHFKFFKGCFPEILLGPFLNTLTHLEPYQISMINSAALALTLRMIINIIKKTITR